MTDKRTKIAVISAVTVGILMVVGLIWALVNVDAQFKAQNAQMTAIQRQVNIDTYNIGILVQAINQQIKK